MERLEPTRGLALKVWGAFVGRAGLGAGAVGVRAGMLIGVGTTAIGVADNSALSGLVSLVGMCIGVAVSVEVMYRLLKKKFKGFELALLRTE